MPDDHVAAARAVYDASADRYVEAIGTEIGPATETAHDREQLSAFADLVAAGTSKRVADVGCGPGRAAALLAVRGLDVVGFDISEQMIATARLAHPHIAFRQGSLDALPIADQSLDAVGCGY